MSGQRHLTWHSFHEGFLSVGAPAIHPVLGKPAVELFTDAGAKRIGLRTPLDGPIALPEMDLASIQISQVSIGGQRYLQVETGEPSLHQSFFYLLLEIADAIQLERLEPGVAVLRAIAAWKDLLRTGGRLSLEAQLGLFGELFVLARLARHLGPDAIDAWTGPWRQPHDFRIRSADIEVKATSGQRRRHTIHGLLQLEPSAERALFIISMSVERGGLVGQTLAEAVAGISTLLREDARALQRFHASLLRCGYFADQAAGYPARLSVRGCSWLVPVDASLPRITRAALQAEWPVACSRIGDLAYELDLEGLGFPDGSSTFLSLLP